MVYARRCTGHGAQVPTDKPKGYSPQQAHSTRQNHKQVTTGWHPGVTSVMSVNVTDCAGARQSHIETHLPPRVMALGGDAFGGDEVMGWSLVKEIRAR